MKGKFKRKSFWCPKCDKTWVEAGKKCKACKQRAVGIKIKNKRVGIHEMN